MNIDLLKQKLTEEGFQHIYEWKDGPDTKYPAHTHKGEVAIYILSGGVTFNFGTKEVTLKNGDRFDVPVGEVHSAKVGPNGCHFLVGEMIRDDS